MVMEEIISCEKCENLFGVVKCSCGARFCETCFTVKHLPRNQKHRRGGTNKTDKAWSWISGAYATLTNSTSRAEYFEQDQVTKWFGLHIEKVGADCVTRLVETTRLSRLIEDSIHHNKHSPRRQFPSITSFVGETGAGKSTLIRSLILNANKRDSIENLEAPVPGAQSGSSANVPTTGEVNLYLDPETFGTEVPHFFADCEGMLGSEPAAAQYQKDWYKVGRRYLLQPKDGKQIDRKSAVSTIYPRFLYIFSDVICMVTRNQRAWATSAVRLLEWSLVGAHNTVNQCALPALIIVLNGPSVENEAWISEDHDATTRDFFIAIDREINEDTSLREMAKKHGDKTMKELLLRNFSSVYVHYIPLDGFRGLGNSGVIMPQVTGLAQRVRQDAKCVQDRRAEAWTLFDAKQLSIVFEYAFSHLASGSDEPFDFGQCRQQISLPASAEGHLAEFLGRSLHNKVNENFESVASVVGSCIVRKSLQSEGSGLFHQTGVFNDEIKETCRRSLDQFLNNSQPCAYIHPETGKKCVNTKNGHAKGHQGAEGTFLAGGNFVNDAFDSGSFLELIDRTVFNALEAINNHVDSNREEKGQYLAELHRSYLDSIPNQSFWTESFTAEWINLFNERFGHISSASLTVRASMCYACLFGRPEYCLPCGHVICFECLREFDQASTSERYPGVAIHNECVLCSSKAGEDGMWPYIVEYRPDLSGICVLSLDGGGVRGIVQLTILRRLEHLVGIDIPFGEFFDLMVGTSAGGLIALGLGTHNLSVGECIERFKSFCRNGFQSRTLAKNKAFSWFVRLFVASIYKTEPLEEAMRWMFGEKRLFGHHGNASRVAVTTTVDSECRLIANYNWGDEERYLNSNIDTWHAARCTSAAPMYFEPALHDGSMCRDGGLTENNPIQVAVDEARTIWGSDAVFDTILSVGCGEAEKPQSQPTSSSIVLSSWLSALLEVLIETMNGNRHWKKFEKSASEPILDRCRRLNVPFQKETEPELDDINAIDDMEKLAESWTFYYQVPKGNFTPILGHAGNGSLEMLADRLRASLYFFELRSIIQQDDVSIIKGWVCCRLSPGRKSYIQLLEQTSCFQVKGEKYAVPSIQGGTRFKLEVSFQQQDSQDSDPIRIDVNFGQKYFVTVSGFPMTLQMLKRHWSNK